MLQELQFSETVYGLGAGIFFIGYFLFEIPSNIILHKVGARVWIARIMITWGLISSCMMFVSSVPMFYALRFLLGAAEAGFFPGIILYLTYWYPAARRGRITTFFMTAVPMSGLIGGPISGWIMNTFHGDHGLSGWQWLFLLEGIPSVIIGVLVLLWLDDRINKAKWLTANEKAVLIRNIAAEEQHKEDPPIRAALAKPRVWAMALIYFSFVMGLYGVGFWMPTLIKATGVQSPLAIGLLTAVPNLFAVIGMILIARNSDRNRERRWHVAIPALFGALGLLFSAVWARQHRPGHRRADRGQHRHLHRAAAVLEPADRAAGRHRRRGRHRADQLGGQPGRLRQPLPGRLAQGHDRHHQHRPVHAGRLPGGRRAGGAGATRQASQ